jgi:ABC-type transport system involved in multi-copper enzyme maturation permease subunit
MPLRWGPGPVFVYESIAATRRRQFYALRSLFVFGLLASLALVWLLVCLEEGAPLGSISIKQVAEAGENFYYAISTTQLLLVLFVAPAATAGAICLDRTRGNLTHMLVTDLADVEIVLGKLSARMLPVLALVSATIPVMALAGLLGGVVFEAVLSLTVITLVLALFGCTLALAISVRATKTHEVLMAVYGIECAWILGPLVWELLAESGVVPDVPDWFVALNPFALAWAPYAWPNFVSITWLAGVLGAIVLASAGLMLYAVLRLRAEATKDGRVRRSRLADRLARGHSWLFWWCPRPSLDSNPVLWREWRRGRPSRLAKVAWGVFIGLSIAGTAWGVITVVDDYQRGSQFLMYMNGLEATFSLLLVSLVAPTVLAEERVRGSLDVLMATPLPTDQIVVAKWWGAFRAVPALAILPAIGCLVMAIYAPAHPPTWRGRASVPELDVIDRIAYATLPVAFLLVHGAVISSVGLALATWIRRVGRAVALSVSAYALVAFGWIIIVEILPAVFIPFGTLQNSDRETIEFVAQIIASACPLGGQLCTFNTTGLSVEKSRSAFYLGQIIVLLAQIAFALVILALSLMTFDRCVGRVPERPRRAPRPPRRALTPPAPHVLAREVRHPTAPKAISSS